MVAFSPDTTHENVIAGGYWYPDSAIKDFSLTHFSGRGVPCLKDIPFMPIAGNVGDSPGTNWNRFAANFSHANETARAGYYEVKFDNGIQTELTATPRTGMARFTYPAQSPATLLIRADSSISVSGNDVTGFHIGKIGGANRAYTLYFAAQFARPFQSVRTWTSNTVADATAAEGKSCGAILTFDTAANPVVQVRVGISYVSLANARANLAAENPGWDFSAVRQQADAAWNNVLNRIQVEGGLPDQQEVFYTALYHCYMHPNILDDENGEYPGMDLKIHRVKRGHHQYQNISSWDLWRSYAPLMAILSPREGSDMAQSLVNYAEQDASVRKNGGALPRWEQVNRNSGGMAGDGDDAMIASAYAFNSRRFDTKAALAAMDKGASDPAATSDSAKARGGLKGYLQLGFVPKEAAVTLEYCNDDFALAEFAKALGDEKKYGLYLDHAQNWKNLFDDSTGLIRPKNEDGTRMPDFSPGSSEGYVEGTAAQYVWMVNFNLRGLIDKIGGDEKVAGQLDHFFSQLNSSSAATRLTWATSRAKKRRGSMISPARRPTRKRSSAGCKTNCSLPNPMVCPAMTTAAHCRRGTYFPRSVCFRKSPAWADLPSTARCSRRRRFIRKAAGPSKFWPAKYRRIIFTFNHCSLTGATTTVRGLTGASWPMARLWILTSETSLRPGEPTPNFRRRPLIP
jgi:predicted alpha-1,2-mannosidase